MDDLKKRKGYRRSLHVKLDDMKNCFQIQGQLGNWNSDDYNLGFYNGMELMMSILEEREPTFRKLPIEENI